MARTIRTGAAMGLAMLAGLANAAASPPPGAARFDWVEYRGTDGGPVAAGQFRNPILAGFYSDPSVVRVGADYYLVTSTFSWFPGIPVFHSRDLVHWRQIGNAIDRTGQLDFKRLEMSRGVFAPAISYHDKRFYIVNTCVDCGGNFVITATNPAGPWSDPVWLKTVEGIDPSLFFDTDGRAWLVNNRAPAGTPRYQGHRAIWIEEFDPVGMKMMGNPRMIVDGGVDPAKNPVWIEGPHLYKVDGKYYLMAAEGGTSVNHSEVVLRADSIDGTFRPAPSAVNPILTQRDLPADRPAPVSATGHADLVQLPDGRWWSVFLGTRPYAADFYNTGRETFLLPVSWQSGWPVILPHGKAVPTVLTAPLPATDRDAPPLTGSFTVHDDFTAPRLGLEWMAMRGAPMQPSGGALTLMPARDGLGDNGRPAFVGRRQQHAVAVVTTKLDFTPREGEMAGLAAVQNDNDFLTLAVEPSHGRTIVRVARRAGKQDPREGVTIAEQPIAPGAVELRIAAHGGRYDFSVSQGKTWTTVARGVDATNLSTAVAGGFVGTLIGPFAQGPAAR